MNDIDKTIKEVRDDQPIELSEGWTGANEQYENLYTLSLKLADEVERLRGELSKWELNDIQAFKELELEALQKMVSKIWIERSEFEKQRDRLAEALNNILTVGERPGDRFDIEEIAKTALKEIETT